jgi:hypothetical protein
VLLVTGITTNKHLNRMVNRSGRRQRSTLDEEKQAFGEERPIHATSFRDRTVTEVVGLSSFAINVKPQYQETGVLTVHMGGHDQAHVSLCHQVLPRKLNCGPETEFTRRLRRGEYTLHLRNTYRAAFHTELEDFMNPGTITGRPLHTAYNT